jgi:hypothetical protein
MVFKSQQSNVDRPAEKQSRSGSLSLRRGKGLDTETDSNVASVPMTLNDPDATVFYGNTIETDAQDESNSNTVNIV